MRITPRWMAIFVITVLFGGIFVSIALGEWTTKSNKEPLKFTEGRFAGENNPADIRGSYTFGDVSTLFEVPLEDLAIAFHVLEPDVAVVSLKTIEEKFGHLDVDLGTGSVKLFVALYKGYPFDLKAEDNYLLQDATDLLKQKASLSLESLAYLDNHTVSESDALAALEMQEQTQPSGFSSENTPDPEHASEANKITGKTTFQNLLDWGVTQEVIEKIIDQPLPSANLPIKDWATSQGVSFSILKSQLQALVDAVK